MIRNQWYVVLESKEVKAGKPVGVTRMGEKLVFWRMANGQVACVHDRCAHLGASLCGGKINREDRVVCPFHAFEFDQTGQCRVIPANGMTATPPKAMRVGSYLVHEAHNWIWIYWGEARGELTPPRFFDIDETFSYGGYHDVWNIHYSRMVENQLDVMHLPFVHFDTIGRGGRTLVDGPVVRLKDDKLQVWVYNRLDGGTPPRKPEDIPEPSTPPSLEFIFPNIWQLRIMEDMRVMVAFVPIDEEHGMFYMRQYQRMVRLPVLREIVNAIGVLGSMRIANQDKRVVTTQLPRRTSLRNGDLFVQGDRAILTYRRRREELIAAAEASASQE